MGKETLAFENELREFVDCRYVVSVNSCTSALFLSLLMAGVRNGDEVICPSLTWCSSANAALYIGASPIFCDVNEGTLCLDLKLVLARVTRKTKAVVVVHFGGLAVDVAALRRLLPRRIAIIEDAAHALGGAYPNGRPVGSSGNLVCFSFYPNKNLATAEGGAIALSDSRCAKRLQSLRQHALPVSAWKRFTDPKSLLISRDIDELGYKMNFTDLQACIARVQLKRQSEFAKRRLAIARLYWEHISKSCPEIATQVKVCSEGHARHLFTILLPQNIGRLQRDKLVRNLRKREIGATIHYAPLHSMSLYRAGQRAYLPVTDSVGERIITLPISASMTMNDARYVIRHVLELLRLCRGNLDR